MSSTIIHKPKKQQHTFDIVMYIFRVMLGLIKLLTGGVAVAEGWFCPCILRCDSGAGNKREGYHQFAGSVMLFCVREGWDIVGQVVAVSRALQNDRSFWWKIRFPCLGELIWQQMEYLLQREKERERGSVFYIIQLRPIARKNFVQEHIVDGLESCAMTT
jgi:hypothetical protein